MLIFKALSALLCYPEADLLAALPDIGQAITGEPRLPAAQKAELMRLVDRLADTGLDELQEDYGLLFDRTRALSLHLFEHVHGESRDRGQAMVDLLGVYEQAGFTAVAHELPDYLPLFLEFVSTREPAEGLSLAAEPAHVYKALEERLRKRGSPYAAILSAVLALTEARPDAAAVAALAAEPVAEPDDLAALDAAWEEEEVLFGPGAAEACGKDGLAAKLRAARRPAPGLPQPQSGQRTQFTHSASHRP
jgi:nitrate reductase delta subunit